MAKIWAKMGRVCIGQDLGQNQKDLGLKWPRFGSKQAGFGSEVAKVWV